MSRFIPTPTPAASAAAEQLLRAAALAQAMRENDDTAADRAMARAASLWEALAYRLLTSGSGFSREYISETLAAIDTTMAQAGELGASALPPQADTALALLDA